MDKPVIYHDPTSEPSRAVHWFALEAGIPVNLRYTWLSRNEHHGPELLAVNPRHQVPAMRHGDFCLSEAAAIIRYLAEIAGIEARWLGDTARDRARTSMLLSWYHTNLRQKSTLNYFLPVLLAPSYRGRRARHRTRSSACASLCGMRSAMSRSSWDRRLSSAETSPKPPT